MPFFVDGTHSFVLSRLIGKYLSSYPILAVISKRCISSEFKDRFESESSASGSCITPRMSPLGVGTQIADDRFKGPTEPGPIAMAQGAKQLREDIRRAHGGIAGGHHYLEQMFGGMRQEAFEGSRS